MWLFFFLAFLGCYAFVVAIVVSKRGNRRSHYGSYRAASGIYGAGYPSVSAGDGGWYLGVSAGGGGGDCGSGGAGDVGACP
jgi:hypothetical protein